MLNKEKSTGRARLKLLFALPIAGGMLCASTVAFTKDYAMIDLYPEKYEANQSVKQETPKKKTTELEEVKIKSATKSKPTKKGEVIEVRVAPPPPPKVKTVKFPPPIVTPDKLNAPKKAVSEKKVKFPPPIVVPDKPVPPPPPPVEPAKDDVQSIDIQDVENSKITSPTKSGAEQGQSLSTTYRLLTKDKLATSSTKNGEPAKSIIATYRVHMAAEKPKKESTTTLKQEGTVTFEAKPGN